MAHEVAIFGACFLDKSMGCACFKHERAKLKPQGAVHWTVAFRAGSQAALKVCIARFQFEKGEWMCATRELVAQKSEEGEIFNEWNCAIKNRLPS